MLPLESFPGIMPAETNSRDVDVLLYLAKAHPYRFDDLTRIGASRAGVFDSDGAWQDALHALARHQVAAVDGEILPYAIGCLWRALKVDPAGAGFVGPAVYLPPESLAAVEMPAGGLSIGEVIARHLEASPVAVPAIGGRLAVRQYRDVPATWRRVVPAPAIRDRAQLEAWIARQRALPGPRALGRWYQAQRAAAWQRMAIGKLIERLAAAELVGWSAGSGEAIPASWWQSSVEIDLATGDLIGSSTATLASAITVYRTGERPAAVEARQPVPPGMTTRQALDRLIAEHRVELAPMPRDAQVEFVHARLAVAVPAIRSALVATFGEKQGGRPRVRPAIDKVIAEHRATLAGITDRAQAVRYVAERLPPGVSKNALYEQLAAVFGRAKPPGRFRKAEPAAAA